MLTQERKAYVLEVLKRDGRVVAKALSRELNLSEDTLRRDLRELAGEGLLQRVHGGALPASPAVVDFAARQGLASEAKIAIGRAAAGWVRPGQVVFLDGGTTAVQVARHLSRDLAATVITHSPSVAVELAQHRSLVVELIGGRLFQHSVVAVGGPALEAISRIRADLCLLGVTGLHPEAGLTTGDAEEAAIKRALIRQSAETMVLASSEKLGAVSPYAIGPLSDVAAVIMEAPPPDDVARALKASGVSAVITG
jgi:DeoR/GlpR family transcriptional regulator of sugar metabolism